MTELTDQMINKLEAINHDNSMPLERRLIDTAVWFHKNKDSIPRQDLEKRLEFVEKTLDIFIEMMAMHVQRMQRVEGSKSTSLFLPNGMIDIETGRTYG